MSPPYSSEQIPKVFAVTTVILIWWSNLGPKLLKVLEEVVHRELDKIDGKLEKSN